MFLSAVKLVIALGSYWDWFTFGASRKWSFEELYFFWHFCVGLIYSAPGVATWSLDYGSALHRTYWKLLLHHLHAWHMPWPQFESIKLGYLSADWWDRGLNDFYSNSYETFLYSKCSSFTKSGECGVWRFSHPLTPLLLNIKLTLHIPLIPKYWVSEGYLTVHNEIWLFLSQSNNSTVDTRLYQSDMYSFCGG